MHQSTTPSFSQTIWPRWAPWQFLSLPIVQTFLHVTALRLSLWDNWGDERGCDEGHWHSHTRGLPWDLPEVVGTVEHVHCSRTRLLRRGLAFHVYTINKSAPTKKVWKLIGWSSYHLFICTYINSINRCVCVTICNHLFMYE